MSRTATPEKSFVSTTKRGRYFSQQIKFINRKGTFDYSPTCDGCSYQGKVQDNLGFGMLSPTCERDDGTWRSYGRIMHLEPKPCKFFKTKEDVKA